MICLEIHPSQLFQTYAPINVAISLSFNTINALGDNLKVIDKAIENNVKGLCDNEFIILKSITGIGDIYAARHYFRNWLYLVFS